MENSESGDDLGAGFLSGDGHYLVQADDLDGKEHDLIFGVSHNVNNIML